jgi:hypothetical protein
MGFSINVVWIVVTSLIVILLLILVVPKRRIREAWLNFLFMQAIIWGAAVIIVDHKWMISPFRLFPNATRQNFFNDFLIFPGVSVLYYFLFPFNRNRFIQFLYIIGFAFLISMYDFSVEKFTDLKRYIHWSAINQFILAIIFNLSSLWFTKWFFKKSKHPNKWWKYEPK